MFKRALIFLLVLLLGLFVQGTLIHGFLPRAFVPNLISVLVVLMALRGPNVSSLLAASTLGLLGDFASGVFVGPGVAGSLVAFAIAAFVYAKIFVDRWPSVFLVTFLCSLGSTATHILFIVFYTSDVVKVSFFVDGHLLLLIVGEAFVTALIAPLCRYLLYGGHESVGPLGSRFI